MKTVLAILTITLIMFATPAFAATECQFTGVSSLSDTALAKLKVDCQQAMLEAVTAEASGIPGLNISNPEALSAYGLVAQEWAKALGIAANELGIAVDTFLDTDAGKLTAAVIIWQVAGESILGIVIGIPLLFLVLFLGIRIARKSRISQTIYDDEKTNWRGAPKITAIMYHNVTAGGSVMYWIALAVTLILSFWIVAGVIF